MTGTASGRIANPSLLSRKPVPALQVLNVPFCILFWMLHVIFLDMDSLSAWAQDARIAVSISLVTILVSILCSSKNTLIPKAFSSRTESDRKSVV